jgi:virulence-associated protein VagC
MVAVRLYAFREFRFEGDEVQISRLQISRFGKGVLLEPKITTPEEWFAELDRFKPSFMTGKARQQPVAPKSEIF